MDKRCPVLCGSEIWVILCVLLQNCVLLLFCVLGIFKTVFGQSRLNFETVFAQFGLNF